MVGGMISALGLTLLVLPVLFAQVNSPKLNKKR